MSNKDGLVSSESLRTTDKASEDQIEYIADLVLELKDMAHRYGLSTLEGILDVAYTEARLRARDCD